ncbi:CC/Se motif family (seleno)protein [Caloramator australicus]|uniref:Uncharacterized protein n=1 Tax=Caloramator australicus RC3 TaxID=857293 RepID=I7J5Z0_9CLOT|nr:CC/Se motif family (seleno)protein [Caloramator australicus]CCJ34137.1 hypothetical protein CAAU_2053 [Caloramator australicus RC3]
MEIKISKDAIEYIEQNGKEAYVFLGNVGGCCGGSVPMPYIYIGKPKELSKYQMHKIENIIIYTSKNIENNREINVYLSKLLWLKHINVDIK